MSTLAPREHMGNYMSNLHWTISSSLPRFKVSVGVDDLRRAVLVPLHGEEGPLLSVVVPWVARDEPGEVEIDF